MASAAAMNDAIGKAETIYRVDWQRKYPQSVEQVWAVISNADEISAWMKFPTRLDPRSGGVIHIDFAAQGSLEGIVCNVEPPRLLVYTWGDSLVKWSLESNHPGTLLHFAHIGVHPELLEGLSAGWHAFLAQLEDHLAGISHPSRYRELKARYDKELLHDPT